MLNKILRLIRIYHDLNQTELAERLGISKSHLSEIESGVKTPTLALLEKYSKTFKVPVSSILFFSEVVSSNAQLERARRYFTSKALGLLEFIAARARSAHAD